jgi:hypothetical protein
VPSEGRSIEEQSTEHCGWARRAQSTRGHAMAQLVLGTALQTGRSLVRFPMVSMEFLIDIIIPAALACSRNEYQEYFVVGKGGRCLGLTTLPP